MAGDGSGSGSGVSMRNDRDTGTRSQRSVRRRAPPTVVNASLGDPGRCGRTPYVVLGPRRAAGGSQARSSLHRVQEARWQRRATSTGVLVPVDNVQTLSMLDGRHALRVVVGEEVSRRARS